MAGAADKDQIKDLEDAFRVLDIDGSDSITVQNLLEVFQSLGYVYTVAQVKKMISRVDINADGVIDFEEFVELLTQEMASLDPLQELRETFNVLDVNGDGEISKAELMEGMLKLGIDMNDDEINEMMTHADADNDGVISWADYQKINMASAT